MDKQDYSSLKSAKEDQFRRFYDSFAAKGACYVEIIGMVLGISIWFLGFINLFLGKFVNFFSFPQESHFQRKGSKSSGTCLTTFVLAIAVCRIYHRNKFKGNETQLTDQGVKVRKFLNPLSPPEAKI